MGSLDLIENNLVFLDEQDHKKLSASEVLPGDLLIVKASVGEKVCRFPSRFARGNITQHIIGVRPNGYADMDYVAAVLFSPVGRRQLARRSLGSIIQYLGVVDARSVLIPSLEPSAQRYIGDEVRQGEGLRARARTLRDVVQSSFVAAGFLAAPEPVRKVGRVRWQALVDRLDALHYRVDLLKNLEAIRRHRTVALGSKKDFGELADGDHGNPVYGSGPIYVRATELNGGLLDGATDVRLDETYAARLPASVWATAEDVMFSIVATLGAVGIVEGGTRAVMSRGVAKVRPLSLPKHYVKAFMRTPTFGLELLRRSVGTIQRGVYLENLQGLEIPLLPTQDIASIARAEAASDAYVAAARCVAGAARLLVEALIEGRLAEADLLAAQRALEAGDRSVDRALLSGLRRDTGVDAPVLFPDLDAFYAFLDDQGPAGGGH